MINSPGKINRFSQRLLTWFDKNGRKDLPWQQDISAYRVWLSEIMLQQTQVATVIPYFERFMARFPIVNALASANEDEVLHLWTGLGYYARARNLHKSAKIITSQYNGELPHTQAELEALPGIGRSTAGAIRAIAFKQSAAILDGNVKRVLARCFGIEGWPGKPQVAALLWQQAEALTPKKPAPKKPNRINDYTQAIMDMGATLCRRSKPQCELCPFEKDCFAKLHGKIAELPGKKPKKLMPEKTCTMLIIENQSGELLLQKRPSQGLWGGLWSFPESDTLSTGEMLENLGFGASIGNTASNLPAFRHTFTHFHLDISPVLVKLQDQQYDDQIAEAQQRLWYSPAKPVEIGLTRPVTKLISSFTPKENDND